MKWRTETCPRCGYTKQSRHVPSRKFRSSEAAWVANFKASHRPADHRCQCCGGPSGVYRLVWDYDHWLERRGFDQAECGRGWSCHRCSRKHWLLDTRGEDDGSEYMLRVRRIYGP
jgi:hypothetical protein